MDAKLTENFWWMLIFSVMAAVFYRFGGAAPAIVPCILAVRCAVARAIETTREGAAR